MLRITQLRSAKDTAEEALDLAFTADESAAAIGKLEKVAAAVRAAYYKEIDAARALQAQYEAMPDEDGNGVTNAGDTFDHATYGNDRFISTEYWRCAIDSAQMMNDEAARAAKYKAERAAMDAPAPVEIFISAEYCAATPRDQWESPDHAWIVEGEANYFGSFANQAAAEACARENVAEFIRLGQHATYQFNA